MQTRGETKVLAAPRIMVLNKQPAEVHLGDQLGYETSTVSQTSTTQTVQFMNVGTQLRLRPFVSSDGVIRMEVHPERSTGQLDANGIPQTNTSEVTTNIMVHDGTTIVIGGLMDTEIDKTVQGIPFLMDLPLLGALFRHTTSTTTKQGIGGDSHAAHLPAGMPRGDELPGPPTRLGAGRAGETKSAGREEGRSQPL